MTDPKRLLPAILLCAFAFALWPSDAAAQRRGRPVRSGGSVVVVRPLFAFGAVLCAALAPTPAFAQSPVSAGPMKVETIDSGFAIAPEARFTEINGEFATLAGGYGGWVTDHKLLIGGADLLQDQLRGVSGSIALRFGRH